MIGQFVNGLQFVIHRQRRLSASWHLTNHLFVKFVNPSRKTLTRVMIRAQILSSIRIDELMNLMNLYYSYINKWVMSSRSPLIISDGLDESDAHSSVLTKIPDLTASTLEGWSEAVVLDRRTPPPPPLHDPGGRYEAQVCPLFGEVR